MIRPQTSSRSRLSLAILVLALCPLAGAQITPSGTRPVQPPPPPPPPVPVVTGFQLIDATSNQVVAAHDPLVNEAEIDLGTIGTSSLSIVALTTPPEVTSVVFELDGEIVNQEFKAPYSVFGDFRGNYNGQLFDLGEHTLVATPYLVHGGGRSRGAPVSVHFHVHFEDPQINAGGAAFVDGAGETWMADTGFSGGVATQHVADVLGTDDDALYNDVLEGDLISFEWFAPPGSYEAHLYFADHTATVAGQRVFDIRVEGQEVLADVDVVAAVGALAAHEVAFEVPVTDGAMNIEIEKDAGGRRQPPGHDLGDRHPRARGGRRPPVPPRRHRRARTRWWTTTATASRRSSSTAPSRTPTSPVRTSPASPGSTSRTTCSAPSRSSIRRCRSA